MVAHIGKTMKSSRLYRTETIENFADLSWKEICEREQKTKRTTFGTKTWKYKTSVPKYYEVLSTAHQLAIQRKKRSLDKRRALAKTKELKEKEILSRKRRGIPGNPCTDDISTKTTIFYAVDSETGKVVELLQDPANRLYQTFYTYGCIENRFLSFFCKLQYVEFLTAVYTGVGYKVEVRPVKIPTHCAITIEFS
ncbi:unnamed protein product [Clavelina lepadiformis]|uniref:Uncharacterized protein n=1 Tax=Clavelina lepadiformis TaxID=159417 RepID=A0ABP0FES4_CLALP